MVHMAGPSFLVLPNGWTVDGEGHHATFEMAANAYFSVTVSKQAWLRTSKFVTDSAREGGWP